MNMKLQISYNELEAFVLERYGQQVKLGFANENTISITKKIFIKDEWWDITINKPTLWEYAMAIEMAISDMETICTSVNSPT